MAIAGAAAIVAGGTIYASKQGKKGAETQAQAAGEATEAQKEIFYQTREDLAPWRQAGESGLTALMQLSGLSAPTPAPTALTTEQAQAIPSGVSIPTTQPIVRSFLPGFFDPIQRPTDPSMFVGAIAPSTNIATRPTDAGREGPLQYIGGTAVPSQEARSPLEMLMADPGYQFRMQQGQQALERSAAARGGLLAGRQLKDLTRYGQEFGAQEYGNLWNRLANIAGIGQTTSQQLAGLGQQYGQQLGQNLQNAAAARASGYAAQGNLVSGALGQFANLYGMSGGFGGGGGSRSYGGGYPGNYSASYYPIGNIA